jgi:hypothetical protein
MVEIGAGQTGWPVLPVADAGIFLCSTVCFPKKEEQLLELKPL